MKDYMTMDMEERKKELRKAAAAAREAAKGKWETEKRIDPNTPFEFAAAAVAASIQADAKELMDRGEYHQANIRMNQVSVLLQDIAGINHPSENHRKEHLKEWEKNYQD